MKVIKRDGQVVPFCKENIKKSINKAGVFSDKIVDEICKDLVEYGEKISVRDIQDKTEIHLAKNGYREEAKAFMQYRDQKDILREFLKRISEYDRSKTWVIYNVINDAYKHYFSVLELKPDKFIKKIKSLNKSEIPDEDTIIKSALELTSQEEPNWEKLAGYLFEELKIISRVDCKFYDYDYLKSTELLNEKMMDRYNVEFYDDVIKETIQKDSKHIYNYSAIKMLYDRYLLKTSDGELVETHKTRYLHIAMFLAMNESDDEVFDTVVKYYNVLYHQKLTVATPTLANAGKRFAQLSSCFIDTVPDSLTGIFRSVSNFAEVSKFGGGMGVYMGKIRAVGSDIRGHKGVAGGVLRWIKIFNDTAIAVDQTGVRAGSCSITLDIWHKDVPEFLQVKTNNGDDRMKAHDIFPAVSVPDLFWKKCSTKEGREDYWYLMCPHQICQATGKHLEDLYGKEWEEFYDECIKNDNIPKRYIKVKDLVKLLIKSAVETGTPFIFNRDTVNYFNPNGHIGKVYSSNLCMSGDSKILTDEGYKEIRELENKVVNIWNGAEFSESLVQKTGKKREMYEVTYNNLIKTKFTANHKHIIIERKNNNRTRVVKTTELIAGDKIKKSDSYPVIKGGTEKLPFRSDYKIGMYESGIWGKVKELFGIKLDSKGIENIKRELLYPNKDYRYYTIPTTKTRFKDRCLYLKSIIDNYFKMNNDGTYSHIIVNSDNHQYLIKLMLFLQELGVYSHVRKVYNCKKKYLLRITNAQFIYLNRIGIKDIRGIALKSVSNIPKSYSNVKVVSVEKVAEEDSYCFGEPKRNEGVVNGVLTGNCVEIAQTMIESKNFENKLEDGSIVHKYDTGSYVVCNLASLVLPNIDSSEMEDVVDTAINMLDSVIDTGFYPIKEAEYYNKSMRAIGLGVSGYHHLLAKKGIQFDSDKSIKFTDKLFEDINYYAIKASNKLAMKKGSYEYFKGSDWSTRDYFNKRGYCSDRWKELADSVASNGIRNGYLMAIAPTGSTSIIANTTPGIDPVINRFFLEEKKGFIVPRVAPDLNDETYWFYKPAHQIDQLKLIELGAIRQRHIDQSQSLNLFITQDYSFSGVLELYLKAWEKGIKTIYYIRSKSLEVEECDSCAS